MPQIQLRDPYGNPIPLMNIRISEGVKSSDEAIYDVFTDYAGNTGWTIPFWPQQRYALHVNFSNVNPRFVPQSYYLLASDIDTVRITMAEYVPPVDKDTLKIYPRHGMSIAGLLVSSAANIPETVRIFQDCGVQSTRINLLSALWPQTDTLPFSRRTDGQWDLTAWNPVYFDRLVEIRDRMNVAGIAVQWTNYELYSWSDRKPGPQQVGTPWRHNVNGVYWPPDDSTFQLLPDSWSAEWFAKVQPYLGLDVNVFEIGNEFAEKALHERVEALFPEDDQIQVNRNEDTPGQYANMKIGRNYDFIAFHGRKLKQVADLDLVYPREPDYKTFNEFFENCPHDPKRIIFSSDGARQSGAAGLNPETAYDWAALREFFREVKFKRGCNIEHQSCAKLGAFPNHHLIEHEWFESVIR